MQKHLILKKYIGEMEYGELKELFMNNLENYQLYHALSKMDIPIMSKLICSFIQNGWDGYKRKKGQVILDDMEIFGLYAFPVGRIFLERFGGLKILGGRHPEWQPMKTQDFQYCVWILSGLDLYTIGSWEALQQSKDELLIPIAIERRYWDRLEIYWSESGKVYYVSGDYMGIRAQNLISYFSQVFEFEKNIERSEWCQETFADYDWYEEIAQKVNQGKYSTYAQRRFAQTGGTPNPITANDDFTKWLLTIAEK